MATCRVDLLFAIGGAPAAALAGAAVDAGMAHDRVRHFATSDAAADAVAAVVQRGDVVLDQRIARREDGSCGGSADGGARLMLLTSSTSFTSSCRRST